MKTEPTGALSIKRANIVDKYLPPIDQQRYYQRLEMHEELIDLINSHSPKIKQLEWIFYGTYYSAETPVTDYLITQEHDFVENDGDCALWINGFPISHSTLEEAKSAAQADFCSRVMECLDIADNSNK